MACGQDIPANKVPSVVANTVQLKFPNSSPVEWEKKNRLYEAEFDLDSSEYTVFLNEAGSILWHKIKMSPSSIPADVKTTIAKDHAGFSIDDAEKFVKANTIYYYVELEAKGKKDRNLYYAANGTPIESNQFKKLLTNK